MDRTRNERESFARASAEISEDKLNRYIKHPIWSSIGLHPRAFFVGLSFLLLTDILDALYPLFLKETIDALAKGLSMASILSIVATLFAAMATLALTRYMWRVGFGFYGATTAEFLRTQLYRHLLKLDQTFFNKNSIGELMSLLVSDIQAFRGAVNQGLMIFLDGVFIIGIVAPVMLSLNHEWTIKTLIFLPLLPVAIFFLSRTIQAKFLIEQEKQGALSGHTQEYIAGIRVVKSFAQAENRLKTFHQISSELERASNTAWFYERLFGPMMQVGLALSTGILLYIASDDLIAGTVTAGSFVAFTAYLRKMVWPMTAIGFGISSIRKGMASLERIKNVLRIQPHVRNLGTTELTQIESIEFRNVSFRYEQSESQPMALKNVSFRIEGGHNMGIIGGVGSGKTTLVNLLVRLYDVSEGQILINNHPIQEFTLRSLRQQISLVPQDAFLFSDSVKNNLMFGNFSHPQDHEFEWVSDVVDMQKEIQQMPNQFETQLGEKGVNLSGGQRQRLTIARAIMTNPSLTILDDSLSAVDMTTEEKIKHALRINSEKHVGRSMQIIVAHRLSSLKNMEKILVLNNGQVEAFGSPDQLMKTSLTFKTFAEIQGES